jgi:hypothetical protein
LGPSQTMGQSLTRWKGDLPHTTQLDGTGSTFFFFEAGSTGARGDDARLENDATCPGDDTFTGKAGLAVGTDCWMPDMVVECACLLFFGGSF